MNTPCRVTIETNEYYANMEDVAPNTVEQLAREAIAEWPELGHPNYNHQKVCKRFNDHLAEPLSSEEMMDSLSHVVNLSFQNSLEALIDAVNKRERLEYMHLNCDFILDESEAIQAINFELDLMEKAA